jgi:hypothetical protein
MEVLVSLKANRDVQLLMSSEKRRALEPEY